MRILVSTPTLCHPDFPHSPNTGLGLMVSSISEALYKSGNEVYVNNSSFFGASSKRLGYCLLSRRLYALLFSSKWKDIFRGFKYAIMAKEESIWARYNIFKYYFSIGYNEKIIKRLTPDYIHIHGLTINTLPFIIAAVRRNVSFVITLHGLNSLNESINLLYFAKAFEFKMLQLLLEGQVGVSVVSSGIQKKIIEEFGGKRYPTLKVILNAIPSVQTTYLDVIRKRQIVCVGNINQNKNQEQLIRAIALLQGQMEEYFHVFFIGNDNLHGKLQNQALLLGVDKFCHFTGSLPHKEVFSLMNESWCTCLLSKEEGFGLSLIEGYRFGLPAICFSDIDAAYDIYDDKCTVLIKERTDEAVSYAISEAFSRYWDRDYIRKFSFKFSLDLMSEGYMDFFKESCLPNLNEHNINVLMDEYMSSGK